MKTFKITCWRWPSHWALVILESYKNPTLWCASLDDPTVQKSFTIISNREFFKTSFCVPRFIITYTILIGQSKLLLEQNFLAISEPLLQKNIFWFFKMEHNLKPEEKISFDAVKKGLVDVLDKLESDQKNLYQGRGFNREWKAYVSWTIIHGSS